MFWAIGRHLRVRTPPEGLALGIVGFVLVALVWITWSLPSMSGPRLGAAGLDRLLLAADGPYALDRWIVTSLAPDLAPGLGWDMQFALLELSALGPLALGLRAFLGNFRRLPGLALTLPLMALVLLPAFDRIVLSAHGAAAGFGLLLLGGLLGPQLRVSRVAVGLAGAVLVHPAGLILAAVALLLVLLRVIGGTTAALRGLSEGLVIALVLGGLGYATGLGVVPGWPLSPDPGAGLVALWARAMPLSVQAVLPLALLGCVTFQLLRTAPKLPGLGQVLGILALGTSLGLSVGFGAGQASGAPILLICMTVILLPCLYAGEGIARLDPQRGRSFGMLAIVLIALAGQAALGQRGASWPDPDMAALARGLGSVSQDLAVLPDSGAITSSALRLAGAGLGDPAQSAGIAVPLPRVLEARKGFHRGVFGPLVAGFDLGRAGLLRLSLPGGTAPVWIKWQGSTPLRVAVGSVSCAVRPADLAGWMVVEMQVCNPPIGPVDLDLTGEGLVEGLSLTPPTDLLHWPWGDATVGFAYAAGPGWQQAGRRARGDFGWKTLGLTDAAAHWRARSDLGGIVLIAR